MGGRVALATQHTRPTYWTDIAGEDDQFLLVSTEADPNDHAAATKGNASNWTLKYFGKDQKLADGTNEVNNDIVAQSGKITQELTTDTDEESETYNTFTYPHDYGEIGTIRVRGKDMEKNMKYVADYGEHNVTIAYQETMKYPYTWDFRDATGDVELARVTYPGEESSQLLCALEDGDEGACILHNKAGNPVSILNSGFHLFVPDMHDYPNTEEDFTGNNDGGNKTLITEDYGILKAQVGAGTIPATEGNYTNYILSNKIYVNDQGETATESVEAFYRVKSTGAKSKGNNGYLPMETDKVTNQSANVFDLVFDIDKDADGINEVNAIEDATINGVYTIDGQKLEGMPTNSGLYIVNGKKLIIK